MFAAPAPYPVPEPVVAECVSTASRTYAVPELVIRTILKVEGGKVGTMSRNTNGSYDLGPMQINTINLSLINKEYPFLTWKHITYNPCINIMVGTWFLSSKIRARKGVIWITNSGSTTSRAVPTNPGLSRITGSVPDAYSAVWQKRSGRLGAAACTRTARPHHCR
jgi:hypothetical protein